MRSFAFLVRTTAISCVSIGYCVGSAQAGLITLSTFSSDETDASFLDATMDFVVFGSTLMLTVNNTTIAPNEYNINEMYFNGGGGVTGLNVVTMPTGWMLDDSGTAAADGFGMFDFALLDGTGGDKSLIMPGETLLFEFEILGSGVMDDFTTNFSDPPPGHVPMIAAAKFISGPGDDSAYGAIPAPGAAIVLLGAFLPRRRRRH